MRSVYKHLVVKPEGKRPHRRHRARCEDNVKMDFQKVGCVALTGSIWLRMGLVNALMNIRVLYNAGYFLTSRESVNCWRPILLYGVSKSVSK